MKKLIYLCVACCFFVLTASAQKINQKDLQGKWTLVALETEGIIFDFVKEDVVIPDAIKSQIPPEQLEQTKAGMLSSVAAIKGSYMLITDNNMKSTLGPQEMNCTFTLSEKDKKQYMTVNIPGEGPDEAEIVLKDNKLHIIQYTEGVKEGELVYTKQ